MNMGIIQRIYQVTVAILRRGDEVLLVQQQAPYNVRPTWVLPGGSVEQGELLQEALVREVREETGLEVHHPGQVAYIVQVHNEREQHQLMVYVFEVRQWSGTVGGIDPDNEILQARFFHYEEAIHILEVDHPAGYEPAITYLRGEVEKGALWSYRRRVSGKPELVWGPKLG